MGGDFAPRSVVEGVVASEKWRTAEQELVIFGDRAQLEEEFKRAGRRAEDYEVVHCSEVITMHDHPVRAIAEKSDSSITVGFQHLATGRIDGFASAGNTGAMMAGTMNFVKVVPGILRPAIAGYFPTSEDNYNILLDVGLNADCKPDVLVQYAVLGSLYAEHVMGKARPRVGLLNIGEEPQKGNLVSKATHEKMAASEDFVFAGNVEGNEIFSSERVDVIVTDGFVGNIVLKEAEALYKIILSRGIRDEYFDSFNFEHYGGTPVLGVNAPVIIGHGISNAKAVDNMIRQTGTVISSGLCEKFKSFFKNA